MSEQRGQSLAPQPQDVSGPLNPASEPEQFPAWMDSRQCMRRVGNASLKAWYMWRNRHGLGTDTRGRVSRVELEQALSRQRRPGRPAGKPRVMAAASLANLRREGRPSRQNIRASR